MSLCDNVPLERLIIFVPSSTRQNRRPPMLAVPTRPTMLSASALYQRSRVHVCLFSVLIKREAINKEGFKKPDPQRSLRPVSGTLGGVESEAYVGLDNLGGFSSPASPNVWLQQNPCQNLKRDFSSGGSKAPSKMGRSASGACDTQTTRGDDQEIHRYSQLHNIWVTFCLSAFKKDWLWSTYNLSITKDIDWPKPQ